MVDPKTFTKAVLERPALLLLPALEGGLFDWMGDESYLRFAYHVITGGTLRLDSPQTFNEKIAWLKLHDRQTLYLDLADKLRVRGYVSRWLGDEWLVPLLGTWSDARDIDFDVLPKSFVLKCTNGYGGTVIRREGADFDRDVARSVLAKTLATDFFGRAREWAYRDDDPRIIAEAYVDDGGARPADYKFMCFNGRVGLVCISRGLGDFETGSVSFFLPDGTRAPFKRKDYPDYPGDVILPKSYARMYDAAEKLVSRIGAPFVRVDFYETQGRPLFSEFTFYPCGGTIFFDPPEYDLAVGSLLELPGGVHR